MKYVYLVSIAYDYDGEIIIAVKTSKRKALEFAENNLGGDSTLIIRYPMNWDHGGRASFIPGDWIVAKWKRKGYGPMIQFERIK